MDINIWKERSPVLVYTMTDGLGDYLVMGDVIRKAKALLPGIQCVIMHRNNPHIHEWPEDSYQRIFFNIYSPSEVFRLISLLTRKRHEGSKVFGLQMFPGSLQGHACQRFLKAIGALDYIVDFNLINADIVTPVKGGYILDRQLNQLSLLFKVDIPQDFYRLRLPLKGYENQKEPLKTGKRVIGLHPWSRRNGNSFFWPLNGWEKLLSDLLPDESIDFVIFGKDERFSSFEDSLRRQFPQSLDRFHFVPSGSLSDTVNMIRTLDLIVTVNTSIVHMAYALDKNMVVLNGPTLDGWIPRNDQIIVLTDKQAVLPGADRVCDDPFFPQVARIKAEDVKEAVQNLLKSKC